MRDRGKVSAMPGVMLVAAMLATLAIGVLPPRVAAAGGQGPGVAPVAVSQEVAGSPEQQLIEKYAPIIGLKDQEKPCDDDGEPYYPVAVDFVFGQDAVVLKRATGSSSSTDEVVMTAPTAADLYVRGNDYYLDLPGRPRRAGCTYERWFNANNDGYEPTAYAHIVATGRRLVVQYWFYYVFNNFNNTHESDWEMMQILFDVGTVEQALQAEPVSVAVAQHGGGETADWDDPKFQRDGNHPVVYAAAGSHATHYGNAVYLGWGENGTGFGCDITTEPTTHVPLAVVLLPNFESDPNSEFAWLSFAGRWGERQRGEFNGPTGPATKRAWNSPFLWQDGLRDSSIEVPLANTFGPAPTEVFCTLTAAGSSLFRVVGDSTVLFLGSVIGILVAIVFVFRYAWPMLRAAAGIYRQRWRTFMLIGLWLIPLSVLFNGFQYLVVTYPPGSTLLQLMNKSPGAYYALALLTLIGQHLASLVLVGPMTLEVCDELTRGQDLSFRGALAATWKKVPALVKPVGLATLIVLLLCMTIVGLPLAIWLLVRWVFTGQASMLDAAGVSDSLGKSWNSVSGRWWRIAFLCLSLFTIAAMPGVLVGLVLLVFGSASVQATNVVSSLIYVVTVPYSIVGLTVLYRHRTLSPPLFGRVRRMVGRVRSTAPAS